MLCGTGTELRKQSGYSSTAICYDTYDQRLIHNMGTSPRQLQLAGKSHSHAIIWLAIPYFLAAAIIARGRECRV